jgi:perosamine synthetase
MKKEIPLSVPNLNIDIVENLRECIETGWVSTGGRFITEFEKKIAGYVKVEDAVSTQSGTAGLHVALRVLGVKEGEEVIVPTLTFIAAVNPVRYIGASPVFMDCDKNLCMDADKLERFCSQECRIENSRLINNMTGRTVSALIIVHVFGNLADMERINEIAVKYHLKVLEDATEAIGSYYSAGKYSGSFAGTVGDMGVYSFNANKIITTGGGGMIVSRNQEYLDQARYLSITAKDDALFFVHNEVGYNYRMLNLQAALGVSQIDELEMFIEIKKRNYLKYKELLSDSNGLELLPFTENTRANHWFYSLYVDQDKFGCSRDELMHRLIAASIQCRPVWKLNHKQMPYQANQAYLIVNALDYEAKILNLPCSTNLKLEEVEYISSKIKEKNV